MSATHDLVIRGGQVVDGTGAPGFVADVAVDGDRITAVGTDVGRGRRELDADGALVTPGWVDIHTHYDGQASWDSEMAPSSWHGVTTAVMGSCGVGFAPVRPGRESFLIELMEGVEDIPGSALHEGIDWRWETFGEYLDALEARPRTIDVAGLAPHAAVRAWVLGGRAHDDDITAVEIAEIAAVTREAIRDGALGVSTSRTELHRSRHGLVPGTYAAADELVALGRAVADAGGGVFQFVSDTGSGAWTDTISRLPGVTVSYSFPPPMRPSRDATQHVRRTLDEALEARRDGRRIVPQVPARPIGMLFGLQSSFHPFIRHATYRRLRDLPLAERVAHLSDPTVRAQLLDEEPSREGGGANLHLAEKWDQIFRLGDPPDYEPSPDASAGRRAALEGRTPQEVVLDWMLEADGTALLFAPAGVYEGDLELVRVLLEHPVSIAGLSDGGAHCGLICDGSFPTYLLTHWARDRRRGPRIPVELLVHKQTQATAATFGLDDRGVLAPGLLADINVIDHAALRLHAPTMVFDLPAGGRRLVQSVDGYVATVKSGAVTFEHGVQTGALPGGVVRRRGSRRPITGRR